MRALLLVIAALVVATAQPARTASPQLLVAFRQTGGLAGVDRGYSVYSTGAVSSAGRRTSRLSVERLRSLKQALVQARFATLRRAYEPGIATADGFTYRITHAGKTIRIEEGAKLPARLARVHRLLLSISSR